MSRKKDCWLWLCYVGISFFVEGKNEDLMPVFKQKEFLILDDHCKQQLAAMSECKVYLDDAVTAGSESDGCHN